jgi:hypothetical protein
MNNKDIQIQLLLDCASMAGIEQITFEASTLGNIEYNLSCDDKDYVTMHKGKNSPHICDKLQVCDYNTTEVPVYKDWYMTINYHS